MIQTIKNFKDTNLYKSTSRFLEKLNIPINEITTQSIAVDDIFETPIQSFNDVKDIYVIGMIDDNYFKGNQTKLDILDKKDYEGILIFAVELINDKPNRKILSDISRAFNLEYLYTPVIIIFKYGNYISLSNTQRQKYKINKEGEKAGKVTILRDINIDNPHRGHRDILENMKISTDINSYEKLYEYWQKVFDIEILQESFYKELFGIFENLVKSLNYPEDNFDKKQNFVVRLIGRMLFLKFLEKKGVVSSDKFQFQEDYYHFKLEPLFFEILNKPIEERDSLLLEEDDKNIPFLNGGLFEPYKDDFYNMIYLNSLKVDDRHIKELLELFNNYYFTIDENTLIDNEVGLDPELLGMVFENLIGYINPETKESARKETGSFYTPREIVEYMVSNALLEYLKIDTTIEEQSLKDLIFYNRNDNIEFDDKLDILKSLNKIKILDPAVGSGAFPMGILNKIVEILNLIDIDAQEWLKLQSKEFQARHQDKAPDYIRKLSIIQNSIFGVDIQPIAIEIAKLRFFLSLLVDEDKDKIEPLPNMEFKFVCANTLLPLEEIEFPKDKQSSLFEEKDLEKDYNNLLKELKKIKENYFFATFHTKEQIKKEFNIKLKEIISLIEELDLTTVLNNKIHSYNPFEVSNSSEFFDNEYMFNLKNESFDIVIGNPPYIRQEKIKPLKSQIENINKTNTARVYQNGKHYLTYNGTADIYVYFFEKSYQLLKKYGIVSFITSNKYTRAKYGKNLRDFVLSNTKILNYLDFNGVKVFKNATVDTSIFTYQKIKSNINSNIGTNVDNNFLYCSVDKSYKKEPLIDFLSKKSFIYNQNDLSVESFSFANPQELAIKKRIEEVGIPLKYWDIEINRGITTGFNEAFVIDGKTKDELIAKDSKSAEIIKPLLRGRDIKRYSYDFADLWLINSHNNPPIDINDYPAIKEHLDGYYPELKKRGDKGATPYNLRNCAFLNEFKKEKIIFSKASKEQVFSYVQNIFYLQNTSYIMTGKNLKYLISILNSKLSNYIFGKFFEGGGIKGEITLQAIEQLPIPQISKEAQKPFEILVNKIIKQKANDKDTTELEREIDTMVYKLYGLNNDEIDIVEGR